MYASLSILNFGPGMRPADEKAADQFYSIIKTMKGFKGATFFADVEVGEYNTLVLWDTMENAEAANSAVAPKMQQALGTILKKPPTRRIFEVYEPKG